MKKKIHVYENMTNEELLSAYESAVEEAKETDIQLKVNIIRDEILRRMSK